MNHTQGCKLLTIKRSISLILAVYLVTVAGPAAAHRWSDWGVAVRVDEPVSTVASGEGCAIEAPNGRSLYIASKPARYPGFQRHLGGPS